MKQFHLIFVALVLCSCVAMSDSTRSLAQQSLAREITEKATEALLNRDLKKAQALYEQALEIENSAEALDGLGCVKLAENDLSGAERMFRLVLSEYPEYAMAYANLAKVEEEKGNLGLANSAYQRALELQPENTIARNNYAVFLYRNGLAGPDRIYAELEKASSLSDDLIIHNNRKKFHGGFRE